MEKNLVSIVIPTYSRANYICRAIDSVLKQTYPNIEIIVVDDNGIGTSDQIHTELSLAKYINSDKIIYLKHNVNMNGSAARNTGVRASHGEYVTFLDDDDELLPSKVEKQVEALKKMNNYDGVYCGFQIIKNNKVLKHVNPKACGNLQYPLLACQWGIGTGSNPMFRRTVFDSIGLFDESFVRHQDIEFLVRFFREYKIYAINEVLINRYIDSRINSTGFHKLLNVKDKFLKTFKVDIERYTRRKQMTIYRNQFADVACHAVMEKQYLEAFNLYKKANSFRILSLKIIAKAIAYGVFNRQVE